MGGHDALMTRWSDQDCRTINRRTIEGYMKSTGRDRLRRHEYFTENGRCINCTTETGRPLVIAGRDNLAKLAAWLESYFPDWAWFNLRLYETRDPNQFWVESDGRGTARMPGYSEHYCDIHYIHSFEMDFGKIRLVREFPDICQKIRSIGLSFPLINRPFSPVLATVPLRSGDLTMSYEKKTWNDPEAEALRKINRVTVETYMNTKGSDRLKRHELFVEDGSGGLWTTDSGLPIVIQGKAKLAEHAVWSLKCFPDWEWYNIQIFETDNPNHFWVECDGHGKIIFPGYPEGYYENHFLHSFELDNGKIVRNREFMNVCQQLRALGIPVPVIRREGIPT